MRMTLVRALRLPGVLPLLAALGCRPHIVELPTVSDAATAVYEVANVRVIHRRLSVSDVVAVRLYLLGGVRQLTEQTAGVEALLLRAAEIEAGRTTARTGSRQFLATTPDWTVTGFEGLREDLDSAWVGFARQLERPRFSDAALERARGELAARARRQYTQPDLRVHTGAIRAALQGHPYAIDPYGTVASLSSLTRTDLEQYWETQFVTSRMLLVVVGWVGQEKIDSLVRSTIGRLPAGKYEWTLPLPPLPRAPRWLVEHQNLPTNYMLGYFTGPRPTDRDYFDFRVAVHLLSARIHHALRGEHSLSYVADAPFLDYAMPIGGIYASTSSPREALEAIDTALMDMVVPIPRFLWWRSLNPMMLDEMMDRMTSDGQAEALARAYLYFGDVRMADDFVRHLARVGGDGVVAAALRYMKRISFAYMGDTTLLRGKLEK